MFGKFLLITVSLIFSLIQDSYENIIIDYEARACQIESYVDYSVEGRPEGVYVEKYYLGPEDMFLAMTNSQMKDYKRELADFLKENLNDFDSAGLFKTYSIRLDDGKLYYYFHSPYDAKKTSKIKEQTSNYKRELEREIASWGLDLSDLYKAQKINKYIMNKVSYDFSGTGAEVFCRKSPTGYWQNTWPAAYEMGKSLCSGYSELFDLMAKMAGLKSRVVSNDSHAWNAVKIDGEWRFFDTTWNARLEKEKLYSNLTLDQMQKLDESMGQNPADHFLDAGKLETMK